MVGGLARSFPGGDGGENSSASWSDADKARSCWMIFATLMPMFVGSDHTHQSRDVYPLWASTQHRTAFSSGVAFSASVW